MAVSRGSVLGFIGGWLLVAVSIRLSTPQIGVFLDVASIVVVLGGAYAAMFIAYEAKDVLWSTKLFLSVFKQHQDTNLSYKNEVGRIVRWAYIVQKNGLQGLETDVATSVGNDPFLRYGVDLVITGYTGAEIREILKESAFSTYQREIQRIDVLKQLGANTPAFGMVGTLIGLIVMLGSMGGDPASIGTGMAVALITTLYGVLTARLMYLPASVKTTQRADNTLFRNLLLVESLVLLSERKSPRHIQDKINAFLDPSQHFLIDRDMN